MEITPLTDGSQTYVAMLTAIDTAKSHIYMANYWADGGAVCKKFLTALTEAARRGVEVRLLLDAHGSQPIDTQLIKRLEEAGGTFKWFQPLQLPSPWRYNQRLHKKLLIIDDVLGFTGGIGLADDWEESTPQFNFPLPRRDTHFRIEGPRIAELAASFADSWSGDNPTAPHIRRLLLKQVNSAQREINIATAYFTPPRILQTALIAAAKRGVHIRIITNGPYTTHWYAQAAGVQLYSGVLHNGIHIYEYQPTMIHEKIMTIDDERSVIGSANWNFRSLYHDEEFCMVVDDSNLTQQLNAIFAEDIGNCKEITISELHRRPLHQRALYHITSLGRYFF